MHNCLVSLHNFHNVRVTNRLSLLLNALLIFFVLLSRLICLLLLVQLWEKLQSELSICKLQVDRNFFIFFKLSLVFLFI